eukprot:CAMPEP_0116870130 /NCGR_PEP_ID=MMETSP0418-20121206/28131_1 /TAXON_ID=1158023 /ORGANISM="Astrosyne radiata, Strain 13vi08-1A" /LENGTH=511 /DNA_ID=CAMNT_0004506277 /DNA_START=936 /DNA_END=2468 /DNA_ORIENTATION=+
MHNPETEHRIAVDIFQSKGTEKQEQLVCLFFDLETVLSQKDLYITERIPGSPDGGSVTLRVEHCANNPPASLRFQIRGYSLPNPRTFLDRPNCCFEIRRKHHGKSQDMWCLVYRSAIEKSTVHPTWELDDLDLGVLCNFDMERYLQIRVLDIDNHGNRHVLGWCETSVQNFMNAKSLTHNCVTEKALQLTSGKGAKSGQIMVLQAEIVTPSEDVVMASSYGNGVLDSSQQSMASSSVTSSDPPIAQAVVTDVVVAQPVQVMAAPPPPATVPRGPSVAAPRSGDLFHGYVNNGRCNIDICVAIDFTNANGDFKKPGTPHHRGTGLWNDYEWIMLVVAEMISPFSHTQDYPIWGLGAVYGTKTYPIFQCGPTATAKGIQGLLRAYAATFETGLVFGEKRSFDDVLKAAAHHAKKRLDAVQENNQLSYSVLLVLTPGNDADILAVKDKIVSIAAAPLSIVFVRIHTPGISQPSFDDEKLQVYLTNKQCRCLTSCVDSQLLAANRDDVQLKQLLL